MTEFTEFVPIAATALGAAIGYGALRQRVTGVETDLQRESRDRERDTALVRADIKRVDEKLESLTDFLLREHGKGLHQEGR